MGWRLVYPLLLLLLRWVGVVLKSPIGGVAAAVAVGLQPPFPFPSLHYNPWTESDPPSHWNTPRPPLLLVDPLPPPPRPRPCDGPRMSNGSHRERNLWENEGI